MEQTAPATPSQTKPRPAAWKWGIYLTAGLLFLGWIFNTPTGLLGKADAVGYAVCHRIDLRSFHLGERTAPLCARCTGMYLGAVLGMVYQAILAPRRGNLPPKKIWLVLALLVVTFGLDGVNSYLHLSIMTQVFSFLPRFYDPSNVLRLLTGTGMGLVIATALYPSFQQTVWVDWKSLPAIGSLRSLFALMALGGLLDLLVLTENPLILYPLALLSAFGVLLLLTMVYTMVTLMAFRYENRFTRGRQLLLPLIVGFTLALGQVAMLDAVRFWLTRTWAGFPLS